MGRRSRSRDRERRSRSRERRSRDRRDRSRDRRDRSRDRDKKAKQDEPPPDDTFKKGRQVIVQGLQKNPEKNGAIGTLVEFNQEKGRWVVAFGTGNNNFKEENLELMPDNSDVIDEKEEPPTAKIYITGLSANVQEQDLLDLFGGCGVVAKEKPKVNGPAGFQDQWPYAVKLYKPGKDNGDAALTYMDPYAAKAAIKTYNRYKWKGSRIKVAYAGAGMKYEKVELQLPWHLREENLGKMDRESGGGGGGSGVGPRPGDWTCSCGATVFASKDSCFKCGAPKPGAGGGGGGGDNGKRDWGDSGKRDWGDSGGGGRGGGRDWGDSGGKGGKDGGKGGRPGDWTCPSCGANVFASKDTCFKCGTPRP